MTREAVEELRDALVGVEDVLFAFFAFKCPPVLLKGINDIAAHAEMRVKPFQPVIVDFVAVKARRAHAQIVMGHHLSETVAVAEELNFVPNSCREF
jgi:hypothetical protein